MQLIVWWAWLELNQRPIGYEPTALTPELQAQVFSRPLEHKWRKERDSNPRNPEVHSLSRGARSATLAPFHYNYFIYLIHIGYMLYI